MASGPDGFSAEIVRLPELAAIMGCSVDALRDRLARGAPMPKTFRLKRSLVTSRTFLREFLTSQAMAKRAA
jgi:hypothetical protein